MQQLSSALPSFVEDSNFDSYLKKNHQLFEDNFPQWRRQTYPRSSTQGAPSIVPTCSEVCMGSHIWESGLSRRIGFLRKRIENALDAIQSLLRRKPKEPDGDVELERRRTRSVEFISRFSRNYLFQLRMQVVELKRQLQHMSLASPAKHSQRQILHKKLIAAYQTAVQGLQACLNQIPGSGYDPAILSKLDQLLCYVCELTSLRDHIDINTFLTRSGSQDSLRQDNIKTKADSLIVMIRRKEVKREEACQAWKQTAGSLAKKRFGLPTTTNAKIAPTSNTKQEKKLFSKTERQGRRQTQEKKTGSSTNGKKKTSQEEEGDPKTNHVNALYQPEHKIDMEGNAPLDPATAHELKIIMSRMKDILRGAHSKPSPSPKQTYPPNVGLVFITHKDVPGNIGESCETRDPEIDRQADSQIEVGKCTNEATRNNGLSMKKPDTPEASLSSISLDSAGFTNVNRIKTTQNAGTNETDEQHRDYSTLKRQAQLLHDNLLIQNKSQKEETRFSNSSTQLRRKLTPEEQRIMKYRNRFLSYKERLRYITHTSEELLSTVFREVASELEPSILLDKMYYLELQG